jgi:hypothetical protein
MESFSYLRGEVTEYISKYSAIPAAYLSIQKLVEIQSLNLYRHK